VIVGEGCHPAKVKVYGPGVEKTGLKANEPTYFTVDCAEAGQGTCVGIGNTTQKVLQLVPVEEPCSVSR
jgi:hypothetical protein